MSSRFLQRKLFQKIREIAIRKPYLRYMQDIPRIRPLEVLVPVDGAVCPCEDFFVVRFYGWRQDVLFNEYWSCVERADD